MSLHAYSRIKHAGLRATSPADLLTRLELVSTQSELSRINHLLERFDERFAPYWEREGRGIVQRMHTGIERAFRENNLGEVVDRAASFYAASELHRRVDLLAMVRPKTGHEHTHGTQVAELAVFEVSTRRVRRRATARGASRAVSLFLRANVVEGTASYDASLRRFETPRGHVGVGPAQ